MHVVTMGAVANGRPRLRWPAATVSMALVIALHGAMLAGLWSAGPWRPGSAAPVGAVTLWARLIAEVPPAAELSPPTTLPSPSAEVLPPKAEANPPEAELPAADNRQSAVPDSAVEDPDRLAAMQAALQRAREINTARLAARERDWRRDSVAQGEVSGHRTREFHAFAATTATGDDRDLVSLVRSRIDFTASGGVAGEAFAEFEVTLAPGGEILALRKLSASGVAGFDEAVEAAIRSVGRFPPNREGTVERIVVLRVRATG